MAPQQPERHNFDQDEADHPSQEGCEITDPASPLDADLSNRNVGDRNDLLVCRHELIDIVGQRFDMESRIRVARERIREWNGSLSAGHGPADLISLILTSAAAKV